MTETVAMPLPIKGTEKKTFDKKAIFVVVKLLVERKPELEDDFEAFRVYWQREVRRAMYPIGDTKHVVVVT